MYSLAPQSALQLARTVWHYRRILLSVTRVEFAKRYSGSAIGLVWVILYPALLLGIYLFVYLVIFKMRFPGYSELDYTLFVFCGLIPYIGFMEALTAGCLSIKQNMHLVKNVMLPIELIPVRAVAVAIGTELVGLVLLLILAGWNNWLSPNVVWLPLVLLLQAMLLTGLVLILAALAVALPDVSYFVNLTVLLLMFISPIGFKPDMVPTGFGFMVTLNPIHYMTDAFRMSVLSTQPVSLGSFGIYVLICVSVFALGCAFFRRFKGVLVDYE